MITLLDIVVATAVLALAVWGWFVGLRTASLAALEIIACLAVAVVLHEPLTAFLRSTTATLFGEALPQAWAVPIAFGILAGIPLAVLRLKVHQKRDDEDEVDIDPLIDRVMGAMAGLVVGVAAVGCLLVTLSVVPFLAGLKPGGDRLRLDVGRMVLLTAGQFVSERHEGRALPVWGEPPSRSSVASARLTSEPWFDQDDDGSFSDADRYHDVDGNGTFTKDLYFEDVDGDGLRRIGLIDKYVVGRWDDRLQSNDRPRPEPVKPAAPQPSQSKPEAAKPDPAPAKPDPVPSAPPKPDPAQPGKPKPKGGDKGSIRPPTEQLPGDDF